MKGGRKKEETNLQPSSIYLHQVQTNLHPSSFDLKINTLFIYKSTSRRQSGWCFVLNYAKNTIFCKSYTTGLNVFLYLCTQKGNYYGKTDTYDIIIDYVTDIYAMYAEYCFCTR